MHNAAFVSKNLLAEYWRVDVRPDELLVRLEAFRQLGGRGVNLTRPLKEAIIPYLATRSRWVQQVGAANVLVWSEKGWHGDNTDCQALLATIASANPGEAALVLGSGGASRASVVALEERGYRVTVSSRTLAQNVETEWVPWGEWTRPDGWSVVVNATPLGQRGEQSWTMFPPISHQTVVVDWVYHPVQTPLLHYARHKGAQPLDGLRLLVGQAALSWKSWFGGVGPATVMEKAVEQWAL